MPAVTEILSWIEQTPLSSTIRKSDWAVMVLEAVHLLGLTLLGGVTVIAASAALRSHGLRGITVANFARELRPVALGGLAVLVCSGSLIAMSMPFKYYNNAAFQWKMAFVACAAFVTALLFRTPSRILALLSFLLWLCVGCGGRLIGFL